MKKIELLAPAGSFQTLRAAIKGGADAIYLGIKEFNMRDALSLLEKKQVTDYPDLKTDGSVIRETVSQLMNTINRL